MTTINPTEGAALPCSPLAALALHTAQGQVGAAEVPRGSNRGPMVDQYLHAVGLMPGYAWCQAFVYWCYAQAAAQLGVANPAAKTAGVLDCWNKSATLPGVATITTAAASRQPQLLKPGSQLILAYASGAGHTGLIERITSTAGGQPILHTIEGNSNNTGSREGYAVVRQQRQLTDKALQGFILYL